MQKFYRLLIIPIVGALLLAACTNGGPPPESAFSPGSEEPPVVLPADTPVGADAPTEEVYVLRPGDDIGSAPSTQAPTVAPPPTPTPLPGNDAPQPPELPIAGIELHNLSAATGLDLAVQGGAHWVRLNALYWSDIEPQEGARNWDVVKRLEQQMINAAEAGVEVILIVRNAPAWARQVPGSGCGPVKPEKYAAFGLFMKDVVSRYSAPPYHVMYWELGNEPDIDVGLVPGNNIYGCMGDKNDPYYGGGAYAGLLKAAYPQIKAANAQAQVLTGGLLLGCDPSDPPEYPVGSGKLADCNPAKFLEGILQAGGGDYFDGVSFHAYDYYDGLGQYGNGGWHSSWNTSGPTLINKTRFVRGMLAAYGHPEKYLVNTEVALLCGRTGEEAACQRQDYLLTKSYYIAQAYAAAQAEGLLGNIWYSITGWRASGLASQGMVPNQSYTAFQVAAQRLTGSAYIGEVTGTPGVKGYIFQRGQASYWLVWSLDGLEHSLALPKAPSKVSDVFGADLSLPSGNEITISLAPVYIDFSP